MQANQPSSGGSKGGSFSLAMMLLAMFGLREQERAACKALVQCGFDSMFLSNSLKDKTDELRVQKLLCQCCSIEFDALEWMQSNRDFACS